MNRTLHKVITLGLFALTATRAQLGTAALPIDLEVATERGVPLAAPQQWVQLLGRMNLGSVKSRSARGGERPRVERKGGETSPRYDVLAILTGRNELLLPDQRFRLGQRTALEAYFRDLPQRTEYNAVERGRFGLSESQFRKVYAELSQRVGVETNQLTARELVAQLERRITTPRQRLDSTRAVDSQPLGVELKDLTVGTVLAYALRCDGLMLVPEQLPGQPLRLTIQRFDAGVDSWPIGWKPAVSSRRAAPQLYDKRNIEVQGFTLSQATTALAPALKLPILYDHWQLAQKQIDPQTIEVSMKKKRTFLKAAVGKLISQARLTEELRVDEEEQPFLWITKFGKNSIRATK